jgi:hypothetical protein
MSFLLSPVLSLQQNQITRGQNRFCLEAGGVGRKKNFKKEFIMMPHNTYSIVINNNVTKCLLIQISIFLFNNF